MHNPVSSHSGYRARGRRQSEDGYDQDQMGNSIQGLKTFLKGNKILGLAFFNFPVLWSINMYRLKISTQQNRIVGYINEIDDLY